MTARARRRPYSCGMDERGSVLAFPTARRRSSCATCAPSSPSPRSSTSGAPPTRLYVSQPALSRQIRALERLVGCELLRRSTHRVELTIAGEALLDRARTLLGDLDDAISATRSVGGELAGRVEKLWQPIAELAEAGAGLGGAARGVRGDARAVPAPHRSPGAAGERRRRARRCRSRSPTTRSPTLLYLHGGGYVLGSAFGYRHLAGALAAAAGPARSAVEYRGRARASVSGRARRRAARLRVDAGARHARVAHRRRRRLVRRRARAVAAARLRRPRPAAAGRRGAALPRRRPDAPSTRRPPITRDRELMLKNGKLSVEAYLGGALPRRPARQPADRRPDRAAAAARAGLRPATSARHEAQALVDHASRARRRRPARALPDRRPRLPAVLVVPARGGGRAPARRGVRRGGHGHGRRGARRG